MMLRRYFTVLILLGACLGVLFPSLFLHFKILIPWLLALIMLVIGINVKIEEFKALRQYKGHCLITIVLKFLTVSLAAFGIGSIFNLTPNEFIGIVIVGCCPGGTAANLMAYLSKANLALTVSLTLVTTALTPIVMPGVIYVFLHQHLAMPWQSMVKTLLIIALLPICIGIIFNQFIISFSNKARVYLSEIAIITIVIIITIIVSLNSTLILNIPIKLLLACLLLNVVAYGIGYIVAAILKFDHAAKLSLIFEFSILDVGLGIVIAMMFFNPEAALAGTIYAILQNMTGPLLVSLINKKNLTVDPQS